MPTPWSRSTKRTWSKPRVPLAANLRQRLRELAATTEGIDRAVYAQFDKDPLEPIIGLGDAQAPLAFFGRDPGREEVRHGEPFVGAGGQLVRGGLHRHLYGTELPDFAASLAVGRPFFWANTVPYKPLGNRAWSMAVKRRFHPLMRELLIESWQGRDIVTLGREAFLWFGIDQPREERRRLEVFWADERRFERSLPVRLADDRGGSREFVLHPLPHPSPRNLAWYGRFAELLEARLQQLGVVRPG
ncbi:uracil-DNA glycosylase [Stutzerimonas balearica]|nr:uracil-DNA glycosylase family protein [Stutzerimonas balearica]OMG64970.1 uracil-DNA glycosylase [Stutzerimonas balearica]